MRINIFLEIDTGELLQIICPDGNLAGKALINFQTTYSNFENLHDVNSEEYTWFQKFESFSTLDIRKFGNIVYSGNWDFGEDNYEKFKMCVDENPFNSEDEYKEAIKSINKLWTPIDQLVEMVKEILRILPRMGDKTYWFHLDRTIMEFQGLLDTLLLAKERHGKEVRIKGE